MASKIAVYLITGFLGSGKTTFLRRLINSFPENRRLMILMNEFGEIGIDGALVQDREVEILEISKGSIFCVCVKTDFIKGLYRIANEIKPDVILIEASGVANPKQLKQDLVLPIFHDRFYLAEQFCIVDAANFESAYETYASVEKQIEAATVFIVNKTDLASSRQIQKTKNLILGHQKAAVFFETTYAAVPLGILFPSELADANDSPSAPNSGLLSDSELDGVIDKLLFQPGADLTPPDCLVSRVYTWAGDAAGFRSLAERLPNSILRAKGFLMGEHSTHLFDWVIGRWTLREFELPENRAALINHIVVIGPPAMIEELETLSREFKAVHLFKTSNHVALPGLIVSHHHGVHAQDHHLGLPHLCNATEQLLQQAAATARCGTRRRRQKTSCTAWEESICAGAVSIGGGVALILFQGIKVNQVTAGAIQQEANTCLKISGHRLALGVFADGAEKTFQDRINGDVPEIADKQAQPASGGQGCQRLLQLHQ